MTLAQRDAEMKVCASRFEPLLAALIELQIKMMKFKAAVFQTMIEESIANVTMSKEQFLTFYHRFDSLDEYCRNKDQASLKWPSFPGCEPFDLYQYFRSRLSTHQFDVKLKLLDHCRASLVCYL
jgi:hypothetical protein